MKNNEAAIVKKFEQVEVLLEQIGLLGGRKDRINLALLHYAERYKPGYVIGTRLKYIVAAGIEP